jgi:hypothetical protein
VGARAACVRRLLAAPRRHGGGLRGRLVPHRRRGGAGGRRVRHAGGAA